MEVPRPLRPYLKRKLSRTFFGRCSSLVGFFLVGFLVSSFEVPCTGGPYFYILARMADDATRMQTLLMLLYYNLIFVLPLILITTLLYLGSIHVEKAREWKDRNKPLLSLARGLPMIAVGLITLPAQQTIQALAAMLSVYRALFFPLITILFSYIAYQTLSKRENRDKTLRWMIFATLALTLIVATSVNAQTGIRNLREASLAQAGCVTITVKYLDGCPVEGAFVILWGELSYDFGYTDLNGQVEKCGEVDPGEYEANAYYPDYPESVILFANALITVDESGNGQRTLTGTYILDNDGNGVGDCHQPQWRNQGQNRSSIGKLQFNYLYAEAKSFELDWAWLSTNEKGYWDNITYVDMHEATGWTWSNFSWSNPSFTGTLSWKIYYNDTSGFTNVTNTMSFEVYEKPPCTNPITECCVIDTDGTYYLANDIQASGDCLVLMADAVVWGNGHTITGDGTGIGVNVTNTPGGGYPILKECKIKSFEAGILVEETGFCDIKWNTISGNHWGVLLYSNINPVRHNRIINNIIGVQPETGYYNEIYHNYFYNNKYNGHTPNDEPNYWNTTKSTGPNIIGGPYIGGNYWHDYDGEDTDGDGIGDTPYTIYGGTNKDYLPLVDGIPPQYLNMQGPTGSIAFNPSATYTFNITWKDNVRLDKVIFELDDANYTAEKIDEYFGFDPDYEVEHRVNYSISLTGLKPGTHFYHWYANDTRNNLNSTDLLTFTIEDKTPPTITMSSPLNRTYYYRNISLFFTVDENTSWIGYSLDGQANVTFGTNLEAGTYFTYVYIPTCGSHNIIVYANDTSGNMGASERVYFTIKRLTFRRCWCCYVLLY